MNNFKFGLISNIATIISGFAFKSEWFNTGEDKIIRIGNLKNNLISDLNVVRVNASKFEVPNIFKIKENDILMALSGATTGKIAIAKKKDVGSYINQRVAIIRGKTIENSNYLRHIFNNQILEKLISRAYGVAQPSLSPKNLSNLKIPIPSKIKQKYIASVLDTNVNILNKNNLVISNLNLLIQNIFIHMFGSTRSNPKKFPRKKLKEIIKFQGGSQPSASFFSKTKTKDNIRLVQIRDFRTDKYKTYIPKKLAKRFFESDDVMIGRYGPPVFQIFRGLSGSYNVALMKATPKENVTKDFIYYLLKEQDLHSFVVANSERTSGQSGVNLDLLENYEAFLPPKSLQIKFSKIISIYNKTKNNLDLSNDKIQQIYNSIQYELIG